MDKQITEGNKITATKEEIDLLRGFMGKEYFGGKLLVFWDWNLLMPVVEKIESLGYKFQICRRRVDILQDEVYPIEIIEKVKQETKLKSTWLAVVEFIKWFNNQKLNS